MALPKDTISDFEKITNFKLTEYLNDYIDFTTVGRIKVIDYYSGKVSAPNTEAFKALDILKKLSLDLMSVVDGNENRLSDGRFWELIELLSEIRTSIDTIDNSSKWLRSAITKGNYSPQIEIDRVLRQFQTLEGVSSETGSNNPDADWVNISLRNDLKEEGYTPSGGNVLNIIGANRFAFKLKTVVDNISGKKVYGIDLNRKLTFKDDDVEALSYDDTMRQTVNILSSLKRGDTPEFPEDGIQASLVSGANRNTVAYPILIRQYINTFERDDTLKALKIVDIKTVQDSLSVAFEVETRLSEIIQESGAI